MLEGARADVSAARREETWWRVLEEEVWRVSISFLCNIFSWKKLSRSAAREGFACGGKFARAFLYRGEHMHAYTRVPPLG